MSELLICRELTKNFGNKPALDHLNLTLERGRIVGLLGPNGSGKTTLLKLINGLLVPTEGEVLIDGFKPGVETKTIVSYLPDRMYLGNWMKVCDLLEYYADFFTQTLTAPAPTECWNPCISARPTGCAPCQRVPKKKSS